ncbi:MAG: DUF4932 domain-containing protein [Gemmatimonadales bacterium]
MLPSLFSCATLLLALAVLPQQGAPPAAAPVVPQLDVRLELLGIAYRLATNTFPAESLPATYRDAVQRHFGRVRSHPFLQRLRQLADSTAQAGGDLGAWEIPSLAVHLGPPPAFAPLVSRAPADTSDGWDDRALLDPGFLSLLRAFYREARAEDFFRRQRGYFDAVNEAFRQRFTPVDPAWFREFTGLEPTERYTPIAGLMALGAGDYLRVNFGAGRRNTHTIVVAGAYDSAGLPGAQWKEWVTRSSVHELVHAYTNQVIDRYADALRPAAESLLALPEVHARVKDTFYGNWQYLLYESLVRAVAIRYQARDAATEARDISAQEQAGFLWIRGLLGVLDRYAGDRGRYPTLIELGPELVRYFQGTTAALRAGASPSRG